MSKLASPLSISCLSCSNAVPQDGRPARTGSIKDYEARSKSPAGFIRALKSFLTRRRRAPIGSDDTFGIDLEGIAPVQPLPSSSSPTTAAQPTPPLVRDSPLSPPRDVRVAYSDDLSREQDDERPAPEQSPTPSPQAVSSIPADNNSTPLARNARVPSEPDEPYAPEPLQAPSSDPSFAVQRVQREELLEEVTESPAKKPGSGQRRRIPVNTAAPQPTSTGFRVQSSSSSSGSGDRQSPTPLARRNTRPDNPPRRPAPPLPPPSAPVVLPSQRESRPQPPPAPPQSRPQRAESSDVGSEPSDPSDEEAVEISAKAASKVIGRKRPRSSLASQDSLTTSIEDTTSSAAPSSRSPAQQRQPAKRSKQSLSTAAIRRVRQERGPAKESRRQRHTSSSEQNDDRAVEITVQRLVNNFPRDADDEDELQQEIPFANRGGETVVDVFAQVCEEVINSTLDHLERMAMASDDADKKKECRIQMRAIGAYREELSSRLLQHVSSNYKQKRKSRKEWSQGVRKQQ